MKDIKGFLKIKRAYSTYIQVCERVRNYKDVVALGSKDTIHRTGYAVYGLWDAFLSVGM